MLSCFHGPWFAWSEYLTAVMLGILYTVVLRVDYSHAPHPILDAMLVWRLGRVAQQFLCIVHYNVYCCIRMLQSSSSSFNWSVVFMALYILKIIITFFPLPFREPIFMIDVLYINRPFCYALTLLVCYVACKSRPRNDRLCVGWDIKSYLLIHWM